MLLREDDNGVLAIGQPSHAWLSGQLARAWGNARFQRPEPYEEVCLAADQHDVGWAILDLEPTLDPETGLPYSFMEMPLEQHLALWRAGPERLLAQSSLAALLVSMHGSRLYRRRDLEKLPEEQVAAIRRYLDEQQRFQERLSSGFDQANVQVASDLIWTWDFLSLAICLDWSPRTARNVPAVDEALDIEISNAGASRMKLEPWPFEAATVDVRCEARRLGGRCDTNEQLREALERAPWETLRFQLIST